MPDREKLRALTPEQRMREALRAANDAYLTAEEMIPGDGSFIIAHGAAAIEAALAEQRALFAAWLKAEAVAAHIVCCPFVLADMLSEREPEAWAERTGWKMEETGDDTA